MKIHTLNILGLHQVNHETCVQLSGKPLSQFRPGQYLQALAPEFGELLPTLLYPCLRQQDAWICCGEVPRQWQPGVELHLRGPRGNGFHLPGLARHVALTSLDQVSLNRLLPLALQALENGAEVTLLTDRLLTDLPAEVEVLGLEELEQVKGWMEYLAVVLHPAALTDLQRRLDLWNPNKKAAVVEVMIDTPMICDDGSACGVCAVNTSRGWKLACKDGPVFSLNELAMEEAGHG